MSKKNTTIYIDTETLLQFDIIAERTGTNRSRWVNSKMKQWIKEQDRLERLAKRSQED